MSLWKRILGDELHFAMTFMKPRIAPYAAGMAGATLSRAALSSVTAYGLKYIMDGAAGADMALLRTGVIVLVSGMLPALVLIPVFGWLYNSTAHITQAEVRLRVFAHLERLPLAFFDRTHSGDVVSRMNHDLTVMTALYTNKLRRFLAPILSAAALGATMLSLDWRIASALILCNSLAAFVNTRFGKPMRLLSDGIQKTLGVMTERLIDLLGGFYVIRLFHLEPITSEAFGEVNREAKDLLVRRRTVEGALAGTNYLLSMVTNLGAVLAGALLVIEGRAEFGSVLALISLQAQFGWSLLQAGAHLPLIQASLAGTARVAELLAEPEDPERYALPPWAVRAAEVGMEDVVFAYDGGRSALDGLNLSVEKGKIAALVGPSGGGKSTILKLLLGFYPPSSGRIIVGGRSLGDWTLDQLRDMTAYVPQDAHLFHGTIEENIRHGKPGASGEEVVAAARAAQAHEFILQSPQGYGTVVGERGMKLSGGERQRVAIARALLKNAAILLLDEATSALDSRSERQVREAMDRLMEGRTVVVIAHRLSTIEHADVIYVVERGRAIEQGTHRELLARGGAYAALYEAQFRNGGRGSDREGCQDNPALP